MTRLVLPGLIAFALPVTAVQASEISLSFGATMVSEYVSDGIRYSDGLAFQPFAEVGFGGAYAGIYTSNIDADLTGADRETGLSLGYRGDVGSFSYDVSVNYYMYDEAFDDFPVEDYTEVVASGTFAISESFYLTGEAAIAPEFDLTSLSARVDYFTAVEGLSLDATFGRVDANYGSWNHWSVGATYAIQESIGFSLAYHDSNVDEDATGLLNSDGLLTAAFTVDFSLR